MIAACLVLSFHVTRIEYMNSKDLLSTLLHCMRGRTAKTGAWETGGGRRGWELRDSGVGDGREKVGEKIV